MHLCCGGFWIPCFLPNVNSNRPSPHLQGRLLRPVCLVKVANLQEVGDWNYLKLVSSRGHCLLSFVGHVLKRHLYCIWFIYVYTHICIHTYLYIYIVGYRWCTTRTPLDEVFNINKNQQRGATQTLFFAAQVVCHNLSFRHGWDCIFTSWRCSQKPPAVPWKLTNPTNIGGAKELEISMYFPTKWGVKRDAW